MSGGPRWRASRRYVYNIGGAEYVLVPARAAFLLNEKCLAELRIEIRGKDKQLDELLFGIAAVAAHVRESLRGTRDAPTPEPVGTLTEAMSTTAAARRIGVTDRAIRKAIAQGRLQAEQVDGRWCITGADVEHYRATRAARAA